MRESNHNFRTSARIYDAILTLLVIRVNLEWVRCTYSINAACTMPEASVFFKSYKTLQMSRNNTRRFPRLYLWRTCAQLSQHFPEPKVSRNLQNDSASQICQKPQGPTTLEVHIFCFSAYVYCLRLINRVCTSREWIFLLIVFFSPEQNISAVQNQGGINRYSVNIKRGQL